MGDVVILRPGSSVEFDGDAASHVALLSRSAVDVAGIRQQVIARIQASIDTPAEDPLDLHILDKADSVLQRICEAMEPIQTAIESLELNADNIVSTCPPGELLYFNVACGNGKFVAGNLAILCQTLRVQSFKVKTARELGRRKPAEPGYLTIRRTATALR